MIFHNEMLSKKNYKSNLRYFSNFSTKTTAVFLECLY